MANGLEERFPFLDNDLVDFAQLIPVRHKLGNFKEEVIRINENTVGEKKKYREYNDGKNVLRKAMADYIPADILNRRKQGFSAPDENWYREENNAFVRELILSSKARIHNFIDKKYITKIIESHTGGKANKRLLIWSFMVFEEWLKLHYNEK